MVEVQQKGVGVQESIHNRVALVALAVLAVLTTSGLISGFSGLYDTLVYNAKAFGDLCISGDVPCTAQSDSLTLMYTIAASTVQGAAFFIGMYLDYFGPRVTICTGTAVSMTGFLCLASANSLHDNLYYLGFFLLALGGPAVSNSVMNFGELFPKKSGAIISVLNGTFNASTIVFLLFSEIVTRFHVRLERVFLVYAAVPATIGTLAALLVADKPYEPPQATGGRSRGEIHRLWILARKKFSRQLTFEAEEAAPEPNARGPGLPRVFSHKGWSGVDLSESTPFLEKGGGHFKGPAPPPIYNTDFKSQLQTMVFWSLAAVTSFFVLRINFYIATVHDQLLYTASLTLPPDAARAVAGHYTSIFNLVFPLAGLAMVPLVGYVLVTWGLGPSFTLIGLFNLIFSVISLLASFLPIECQVLSFVAFSITRTFVFSAMAAYIGRLFGFRNYGKLFGVARVVGACCTTLQYPLASLVKDHHHNDFFYVNLGFLVASILCFFFPLYLWQNVFYGFMFPPPILTDESYSSRSMSRSSSVTSLIHPKGTPGPIPARFGRRSDPGLESPGVRFSFGRSPGARSLGASHWSFSASEANWSPSQLLGGVSQGAVHFGRSPSTGSLLGRGAGRVSGSGTPPLPRSYGTIGGGGARWSIGEPES